MIEIDKHFDEDQNIEKQSFYFGKKQYLIILSISIVVLFAGLMAFLFIGKNTTENIDSTPRHTVAIETKTDPNVTTLIGLMKEDQKRCTPDSSSGTDKRWVLAKATINCETFDVDTLNYGLFNSAKDLDDTYRAQAQYFIEQLTAKGQKLEPNKVGTLPCENNMNESGQWGIADSQDQGGFFICISEPNPMMFWTESSTKVIGQAEIKDGDITELSKWWIEKAGPK